MSNILIVDYEGGNLASLRAAVRTVGGEVSFSNQPGDIEDAEKIIVPGVGAYKDAMEKLSRTGWADTLKECAATGDKPILGVCVGMQILSTFGEEGNNDGHLTSGLDLIPGVVQKLKSENNERVPHMGWNNVNYSDACELFDGIPDQTDFYFAHSYRFIPDNEQNVIATTDYCSDTVVTVRSGNVFGAQFHPEISSGAGLMFLKNFIEM
ncbi:imidazole glycerol phosphate synthase subunit HisH [Curvivirga sp.]|uniref:imidazole glycerol phosphate synthase subunit HisH n=1 Tax=Curvivirga sp. TaxID=2856848 RepID=UPI003B59395E